MLDAAPRVSLSRLGARAPDAPALQLAGGPIRGCSGHTCVNTCVYMCEKGMVTEAPWLEPYPTALPPQVQELLCGHLAQWSCSIAFPEFAHMALLPSSTASYCWVVANPTNPTHPTNPTTRQVQELLCDHLAQWSCSIAFPELALMALLPPPSCPDCPNRLNRLNRCKSYSVTTWPSGRAPSRSPSSRTWRCCSCGALSRPARWSASGAAPSCWWRRLRGEENGVARLRARV